MGEDTKTRYNSMTDQYKITSIYYTKPRISRTATGEVIDYRYGVTVTVDAACDYDGIAPKKVTKIEFDDDLQLFKVYFEKGGLKTIPMLPDTEVCYSPIKKEK